MAVLLIAIKGQLKAQSLVENEVHRNTIANINMPTVTRTQTPSLPLQYTEHISEEISISAHASTHSILQQKPQPQHQRGLGK